MAFTKRKSTEGREMVRFALDMLDNGCNYKQVENALRNKYPSVSTRRITHASAKALLIYRRPNRRKP